MTAPWHARPNGAADSWAADDLRWRGLRRLVRLQLAEEVVEGIVDDVLGDVLVIYSARSIRRVESASVQAFSISAS